MVPRHIDVLYRFLLCSVIYIYIDIDIDIDIDINQGSNLTSTSNTVSNFGIHQTLDLKMLSSFINVLTYSWCSQFFSNLLWVRQSVYQLIYNITIYI